LGRVFQQTLKRYRSLVENAVEGIFQTTPEGRFIMANPMLARIYGYDSPEELMHSLTDIARQLYVDPERRNVFTRLLQKQDAVHGFESQVYRRDGQVIWISETARAVRDVDGRLLGFEGTVEDITRRKQAEEERAQALAALVKAREDLEVRVRLRTAALAETNSALRAEIAERRRAEEDLAEAHRELTEAHREMAEAAAEKKRFYREVIRFVTRDRFHLVDAADIPDPGPAVLELPLESLRDDGVLRKQLRQVAADAGMAHDTVEDLVLAVGEAATNAIKHAVHGRCTVYQRADSLAVRVSDQGAGIRADDLPASILLPGFSKAVSLGMGYTLMLELVDRIWLATGPEGTIVQLEKWITAPKEQSPKPPLVTAWDRL